MRKSPDNKPRRVIYPLFWILALLTLSQLTRFSNTFRITVKENKAFFSLHQEEISEQIKIEKIKSIKAVLQNSMIHTAAVRSLKINQEYFWKPTLSFYLFGRDLFGNLKSVNTQSFFKSFGDWTHDRFRDQSIKIADTTLTPPFTIDIEILGRGEHSIILEDTSGKLVAFNGSDGFIDNSIGICVDNQCFYGTYTNETRETNILRIFNFFIELALVGYLLFLISKFFLKFQNPKKSQSGYRISNLYLAIAIISISHFCLCLWFNKEILGGIPHIPDSAIYYRQAILLADGRYLADLPPTQPHQAFLSNSSILRENGIEYRHANLFWPLILAPFVKFNLAFIMPPLLSTLNVWLIFLLVKYFFNSQTAILSSLFYGLSPFSIIMAGDYMQHMPTLTLFLGGILFFLLAEQKAYFGIISGFLLAYSFGIRQLTVTALLIPFAPLLAANIKIFSRQILWALTGALPVSILFLYNNYLITGSSLKPIHSYLHALTISVSNLNFGLNQIDSHLAYLQSILWGGELSLLFWGAIFAGLFFSTDFKKLFLAIVFLSLSAGYSLLNTSGLHGYGPRFLFEGLPALFILAGCCFEKLLSEKILWKKSLVIIFLSLLVISNVVSLIKTLPLYRGYNQINEKKFLELKTFPEKTLFVTQTNNWNGMELGAAIFDPEFKKYPFIKTLPNNSEQKIIEYYSELGYQIKHLD
ncbi:MAG TPA: hypothetical protein PKD37_02190 [Oligoflexia bacterium]|nr:hypothetical protein [Oligoflexia bacterium]HMP26781.1 hypothetical protein [Oligoflexia bacterium]